jgi:hypothetical protein
VLATYRIRRDGHGSRCPTVVDVKPAKHARDRDRLGRIDGRRRTHRYALAEPLVWSTLVMRYALCAHRLRKRWSDYGDFAPGAITATATTRSQRRVRRLAQAWRRCRAVVTSSCHARRANVSSGAPIARSSVSVLGVGAGGSARATSLLIRIARGRSTPDAIKALRANASSNVPRAQPASTIQVTSSSRSAMRQGVPF